MGSPNRKNLGVSEFAAVTMKFIYGPTRERIALLPVKSFFLGPHQYLEM
jgi:hypothetical protein